MTETEDPRVSLTSKSVTEQSAAARDLARMGCWDDLDSLVALAKTVKSTGVRLYAAAAAADIVHRERAAGRIDITRELDLLSMVSEADPAGAPSLLMLLSAVEDRRALDRLGRMLRDPRAEVRLGAIAAVRRLALSATAMGRDDLAERFVTWLTHKKLTADVAGALAELVGELGLATVADAMAPVAYLSPRHEDMVSEAVSRLSDREDDATWRGLWRSDGVDVMELAAQAQEPTWLTIGDDGGALDGDTLPFTRTAHGVHLGDDPARLIWAPPLGSPDDRVPVIQTQGRSFWRVEGQALVDQLLEDADALPDVPTGVQDPTTAVEGVTAARARALWAYKSGDLGTARLALESLTSRSRPLRALFYWLARVAQAQGDRPRAAAAAAAYLSASKRAGPLSDRAQDLLATVSDDG